MITPLLHTGSGQAAGFLSGPITMIMWLPMLAFEVRLSLWLIIRGVATPARAA